ncbi:hypothetical protein [Streptomyces sp. NPDC041003]|uniref:hypothetical protein n=1 Tax=Streptomyces TaxID=1883 RepID=UPI00340959D9|nr:hypothetical protein OG592_35250 [Streptomyces avidinii]
MTESEVQNLHRQLAERAGIDEESVQKVLQELGLQNVLAELKEHGYDRPVQVSNLKLAVKVGRNCVCV